MRIQPAGTERGFYEGIKTGLQEALIHAKADKNLSAKTDIHKILFLDIDGVLNHCGCTHGLPWCPTIRGVVPRLVNRLNHILEATSANVVLSSDWRLPKNVRLKRYLFRCGIRDFDKLYLGDTPELPPVKISQKAHRGDEIAKWIVDHGFVGRYAIVDDNQLLHPSEILNNFFQTNDARGLTDEIAEMIIQHLNTPTG